MTPDMAEMFYWSLVSIALIFVCGLYCILVTFNIIRALIGLEILIKGSTLLIILAGYLCGRTALAQAIVITLVVIEIVTMVVAGGVALWAFRHNQTIDPRKLSNLKG